MPAAIAPVLNPVTLEGSYRYCRDVARKRAKNFYYSFLLLQKPQRDAMCAIYAFMRVCDDLSDDPANSDRAKLRESIALWRVELDRALAGSPGENPLWPAFSDSVRRYAIPHRFFHEMIDGITSDLDSQIIQTWDELYRYCYQVASVVGLAIIYVFGFRSVRALLLAEKCGIAFQLTNILRDVREDAEAGRIYLPAEDLERFGVKPEQLRSGQEDESFRRLMAFESGRAKMYYEESAPLESLIEVESRRSLWALRQIYLSLLGRLERANYAVLSQRINVPTSTKIALLLRAFFV
ncbi:MAG: phytoene/squalene synthase family protein [Bryobacteraceae bacterium]